MAVENPSEENQEHDRCSPLALVSVSPLHNSLSFLFLQICQLFSDGERRNPSCCVLEKEGEGGLLWIDFLNNNYRKENNDFSNIHNKDTFWES